MIALCIFVVGLFFGLKIVQITLRAASLFRAVIRATIILGITVTPAVALFSLIYIFKDELLNFANEFATTAAAQKLTIGLALFALFYLSALILCVHLTVIAAIFWTVVAL